MAGNTPAVLEALAAHCIKATFFPIGKHAVASGNPAAGGRGGHTVGTHTWSHANLEASPRRGQGRDREGLQRGALALGGKPLAPFFRFPALKHPPDMVTYLGERNIGIFSTDLDSFDFKMRKPERS